MTTSQWDWGSIRPLQDSQRKGFEELCCQLARSEVPSDADFRRKGDPDAGVECIARVSEEEWGWQAKYHTSTLNESQFQNIDDSVEKALDNHPALARYYVCVPVDRPEGGKEDVTYMMDRWDNHKKKWDKWAEERGRSVRFIYWGSSELLDLLSREEHRGRRKYWFGQGSLSEDWFRSQVNRATDAAGPRYTPEIHIDLPISQRFDAIGRTERFFTRLENRRSDLKDRVSRVSRLSDNGHEDVESKIGGSVEATREVLKLIAEANFSPNSALPFKPLLEATDLAIDKTESARRALTSLEESGHEPSSTSHGENRWYQKRRSALRRLTSDLRGLSDFCGGIDATLASSGLLILSGEAGVGKTHLFCDIAQRRVQDGRPTVLLLGEQFTTSEDPWTQTLNLLGFRNVTAGEFIGALEAAAQVAEERVLVMIDALNEGQGRDLWHGHVYPFVSQLRESDWIAVALSIRTSYEEAILPSHVREKAGKITHEGFRNVEYDAAQQYFDHYGIEYPSSPILAPEFQNPLFLKILCEGFNEPGDKVSTLPRGVRGITNVFDRFLNTINERLAHRLAYPKRRNYVRSAVHELAREMTERRQDWLPVEDAVRATEKVPIQHLESSLYDNLVSEGVLSEERRLAAEQEFDEVAKFAYERLSDHLIISHLLDEHLEDEITDPESTAQALFREGGNLAEWMPEKIQSAISLLGWETPKRLESEGPLYYLVEEDGLTRSGLIEALCIQIPERLGVELAEATPKVLGHHAYTRALCESIVWRDKRAFSNSTKPVLNNAIESRGDFRTALDALIRLAAVPDHPFNAEFLHERLDQSTLPNRDAWWSTYLRDTYEGGGVVEHLLDWASSSRLVDEADSATVRLVAIPLIWFLSSSNRFLRDRSTKALVRLLDGHIELLSGLFDQFAEVDDVYVRERLCAVAYGCAMRSSTPEDISPLAETVYSEVFQGATPTSHILLRDYARGVIERALSLDCNLNIAEEEIRPPYDSSWPDIPSEGEVDQYENEPMFSERARVRDDDLPDEPSRAQKSICHSVGGFGDFARYIIGTNSSSTEWLSVPLDAPDWCPPERRVQAFIDSLEAGSKEAWSRYEEAERKHSVLTTQFTFEYAGSGSDTPDSENDNEDGTGGNLPRTIEGFSLQEEHARNLRDDTREQFLDTLSEAQQTAFFYLRHQEEEFDRQSDTPYFDLNKAQRWILKRVFELGWTEDRFGDFDRRLDRLNTGRSADKPERIGKKYQWIAYHEFMALLSDNRQYYDRHGSDTARSFTGPWMQFIRDIDPSCILDSRAGGTGYHDHDPSWWSPKEYDYWRDDDEGWLQETDDLHDGADLLLLSGPDDDSRWVNLDNFFVWSEPVPENKEEGEVKRKELNYVTFGYFVKASDLPQLRDWAGQQNFYGRWMPEPLEEARIFLGEHCWAPASRHFRSAYFGGELWRTASEDPPSPPLHVAIVRDKQGVGTHDCSLDENLTLNLPSCLLRSKMGLRWAGEAANFVDEEGMVCAFDPTAYSKGPDSFLVEQSRLLEMMDRENLALFWALTGEKQVLPAGPPYHDVGRLHLSGAYFLTPEDGFSGAMKYGLQKPGQHSDSVSMDDEV